MQILKYKKSKTNEYKILTDEGEFTLYDDTIIKYELLLRKEFNQQEWESIIKENNLLKAYYECLKLINIKLRTKKELNELLKKKSYTAKEIAYALGRLQEEGYLNTPNYINAYIHDALTLKIKGELKIKQELEQLGLPLAQIEEELNKIDRSIYQEKIEKYILKKLKANKKSTKEFLQKTTSDLLNKGFILEDIKLSIEKIEIEDNLEELAKLVNKLYRKYINKYDSYTTKIKIKQYLYAKGYKRADIDKCIKENIA